MIYDDFIYTVEVPAASVNDFLKAASTFHTVDVSVVKDSFTVTSQEGEEEVSMQFQAMMFRFHLKCRFFDWHH